MLVYYLGNFVSNQSSLENLLGGLADFTLKKDAKTGEVTIEDYGLIPVIMHYNSDYTEVGVYQLEDYTEVLAKDHGIHEVNEEATFSRAALESAAAKIGELTVGSSLSDEDGDSGDSDSKEQAAGIQTVILTARTAAGVQTAIPMTKTAVRVQAMILMGRTAVEIRMAVQTVTGNRTTNKSSSTF